MKNIVKSKVIPLGIRRHLTPLNISVFLFVLLFIAVGVKFFLKKPEFITVTVRGAAGSWWWVTPPPPYYVGDAIHPGDKEYDSQGRVIAEVLSIRKFGTGSQNRQFTSAEDKDFVLRVRLRVSKDTRTTKLWFKGNVIGVGSPIVLETGEVVINGTITEFNAPDEQARQRGAFVTMRLYNIYPWEAEKVHTDDRESDADGKTIFEVVEKTLVPAEMTVVTDRGDVLVRQNPLRVDMTLRAKVTGRMIDDTFLFKDEQVVKVGKVLFVTLPQYDLNGSVIVGVELTQ